MAEFFSSIHRRFMNTRFTRAVWAGMIGSQFALASMAAETSLSIGNMPGSPGDTVTVPIHLRQPSSDVVAMQFDVTFEPARVSAGAAVGTTRLTSHTVKSREIAPGIRRTLVYSPGNAVVSGTNGSVVTVPFTVSPQERISSGPL